jgi:Domain of unknown function (DUF2019)
MNFDHLVKEFADCVAAQSEAMARNDPGAGNRYAKRYIAAFEKLRPQEGGRDALAVLLADDRAPVRVMAAAYLLRHSGANARAVLEREAGGKGLIAFGAAQALKRWDEGSWALDPE